jgi:hypothetical protein
MDGWMAAEFPELARAEVAERRRHAERFRLGEILRRERKADRR